MKSKTASSVIALLLLAAAPHLAVAAADDAKVPQPGKAAAHAALADHADLPAAAPQLPLQASDRARDALGNTAFGKKGRAESQARSEAERRANANAVDAHADAADRAAQGSVAAAARSATADARAAAGQARANSTKAAAAGHRPGAPAASVTRP
jgi:hypothetical protein